MKKLKEGDIIKRTIERITKKRKIHGVCGEVVFVSEDDNFSVAEGFYTHKEIGIKGWVLEEAEEEFPKDEDIYFIPDINNSEKYTSYYWYNNTFNNRCKEQGLICRTKEEAIEMTNKMLDVNK